MEGERNNWKASGRKPRLLLVDCTILNQRWSRFQDPSTIFRPPENRGYSVILIIG